MRKLVRRGLGTVAVAFVAITVAHLPPFSGWLGWNKHTGKGPCPFGYGGATEERVTIKHSPVESAPIAKARPALGFTFGHTTREELLVWGFNHGSWCTVRHGGGELECQNARLDAPIDGLASTVWFELDEHDRLAGLRTVRKAATATQISDKFASTTSLVTSAAGPPAVIEGSSTPSSLSEGTLRQASADYRFRDYHAQIRATNMGNGYVLTESYTALD